MGKIQILSAEQKFNRGEFRGFEEGRKTLKWESDWQGLSLKARIRWLLAQIEPKGAAIK